MKKLLLLAALPALLISNAFAQDKEKDEDESATHTSCASKCSCNKSIGYISPIKFSENGVGFELGYERIIDKAGIVSYNIPVMATFNLGNNDYYGNPKEDPMVYIMPGIKFYPTSCYGKVKYAVGPSIVLGYGQETQQYYPYYNMPNYGSPYSETKDKFVLGVTVNNSLNITPSDHFVLGLDFGFGFTYINRLAGENKGMQGLVNGGFRMGYKW